MSPGGICIPIFVQSITMKIFLHSFHMTYLATNVTSCNGHPGHDHLSSSCLYPCHGFCLGHDFDSAADTDRLVYRRVVVVSGSVVCLEIESDYASSVNATFDEWKAMTFD